MNDAAPVRQHRLRLGRRPRPGHHLSRTRGHAAGGEGRLRLQLLPTALNTRDPNIKSLADYTEKDKIAVPAVKVSNQAIFLQMAAAKLYGMAIIPGLTP